MPTPCLGRMRFKKGLLYLCLGQALSAGIFPASSLLDTIKSQLKVPRLADTDRTLNVGSLVTGGFDKLGYIPVSTAVQQCQGLARTRVENTINRLRKQAESQVAGVSQDVEARCRSYVEYAAEDCSARVNGLAGELEKVGRELLAEVGEECTKETTELVERTTEEETSRFEQLAEQEEDRLRRIYEGQGREVEKEVLEDFNDRGKEIEKKIRAEYELRGKEEEEKIRREFELRGEIEKKTIELELRKRGEVEAVAIREEFEERGRQLEVTIRKEFEKRGEEEMKKVEAELRARGVRLRDQGEEQCTEMINMACQDVVEGTESEEFCEEFFFFTSDLSEDEIRRRKRLGLYTRRH